jgi:hypothetical protein
VGSGGTPGMITDDSETLRLYNLESELVGGVCGAPDSARHYNICLFQEIPVRYFQDICPVRSF